MVLIINKVKKGLGEDLSVNGRKLLHQAVLAQVSAVGRPVMQLRRLAGGLGRCPYKRWAEQSELEQGSGQCPCLYQGAFLNSSVGGGETSQVAAQLGVGDPRGRRRLVGWGPGWPYCSRRKGMYYLSRMGQL